MKKRLIRILITAICMSSLLTITNSAATKYGFDGCAIYRGGVALIEWHAGIMK